MDIAGYRGLLAQARRASRRADEAEDLVQATLLAGLEAGRQDLPWLSGTLANLAAMTARGEVRRRRREASVAAETLAVSSGYAGPPAPAGPADEPADPAALLARLPRSARIVALMALHGLGGEEIRCLLGLSDTAFRQRLSRIRRALGELPPAQRAEAMALAYVRDPARASDLQYGLLRRALKAAMAAGGRVGTHDADGHLLVLDPGAHDRACRGNEFAGPHQEEPPC